MPECIFFTLKVGSHLIALYESPKTTALAKNSFIFHWRKIKSYLHLGWPESGRKLVANAHFLVNRSKLDYSEKVTRHLNFSLSLIRFIFQCCWADVFVSRSLFLSHWFLCNNFNFGRTLCHIVCQSLIDQSSDQVNKFRANRETTWCSAVQGIFTSRFHYHWSYLRLGFV